MISKKKIVAIVLFILMGFIMFTFANPSDGISSLTEPINEEPATPVEEPEKEVIVNPVVVVDNAPVITVNPAIVKIVDGTEYNVLTGVTATDDKDTNLVINASITAVDKVGEYDITYTVTDSANHTATATRKIFVLEKDGDEDNDHYTNEEELEAETDFDDEESIPDYNYAPSIEVEGNFTSVVYDKMSEIKESCTDQFYGTKGVTCEVDTTKVDLNNVGTYKVTITATDNLKNVTTKEVDYEVTVRYLNAKISDKTSIYGEELAKLDTTTDDNQVSGHLAGITLTKEEGTDAGTYAITGTWTDKNYNVRFIDGTYTITKASIAPEFEETNFVYTGKVQIPTATLKGVKNESIALTIVSDGTSIDTGNYLATASFKEAQKNYELINNTKKYSIATKELTEEDLVALNISLTGKNETYNGEEHSLAVLGDTTDFDIKYQGNNKIDAGTYTVIATITASDSNKNYTGSVQLQAKLVIEKKELTPEFSEANFTYNREIQIPTATLKGVKNENIALTVESDLQSIDAGTYTATASFAETQKNYELINNTKEYSIAKKNLTKEDLAKEGCSFKGATLTYDGKSRTIGASLGTLDDITLKYTVDGEVFEYFKAAGVYNIIATFSATPTTKNYVGSAELTATVTVQPKKIEVVWDTTTALTYNGTKQVPTAQVNTGVSGETVTLSVSGGAIDAGEYTAIASIDSVSANTKASNYELTNNTYAYTIGKKTVTEEDLKTLGFEFEDDIVEYDGNTHNLVVTMPKDFKATVSYDKTDLKDASTYDVKATITMNSDNENFTGSISLEAKLIIRVKSITVEWGNETFTYNGTKQMPTAKVKDVNHNEISLTVVSNGASVEVGTYTATASFTEAQNNYSLSNNTKNYNITTLDLSNVNNFGFADKSVEFNGASHTIEATGFSDYATVKYYVCNDECTEFNGATNVGEYNLKAVFTGKGNYSGEVSKTATLTIKKAPAVQTGILVEVKPNVQLEFKKGANVNIKDYINVYKVYSDGSKNIISDYEVKDFSTKNVVNKKQLTIKSGKYTDRSLTYSIISEEAFQTKFEVIFTNKKGYDETKDDNCRENCDTKSKTKWVSTEKNVLEIIEHYNEKIKIKNIIAHYSDKSSVLELTKSVRWSRQTYDIDGYSRYNPVYIASRKEIIQESYKVEVCDSFDLFGWCVFGKTHEETRTRDKEVIVDVMNSGNKIQTVDITYTREFSKNLIKTYKITFEYTNGVFKVIDEVEI